MRDTQETVPKYEEEEVKFFQPIWNTTSNRRTAAIVAWAAMVLITIAAFIPAYGKAGNFLTDAVMSGINAFGSALGVDAGVSAVSSFTLFAACRENLILMILFIVALVIGYLLPFLTETAFELLPGGLLTGINIYVCTHANAILIKMNSTAGADSMIDNKDMAVILETLGLGEVRVTTAGCILSYVGIALLVIAVILHLVLKPRKKTYTREEYMENDYEYAGDPYGNTGLLYRVQKQEEVDTVPPTELLFQESVRPTEDTGTVLLKQEEPMGTICRLNTNETVKIYPGEMILGRDRARAAFVIENVCVSSVHAKLIAENGICSIVDLHSTNGTCVNDQKLAPDIKVNLKDGDYIALGAEILQFREI